MVLSLSAKGLTTGEISAHLAEVYGASVSKGTISAITERVVGELTDWQSRPLDAIYPVMFIDAIFVKIRDGQVANRPVYVAIGVTVDGERDILGLWAGQGGEGAKYWLTVLTEIKNRDVADVCIVCCDGLKGLPDAIGATWPLAIVQTCVLHLIRHTFVLLAGMTGIRSPKRCDRSTPRRAKLRHASGSSSSPPCGARNIPGSSGCGTTPGPSSCRSSPSKSRSDA